MPNNQYPKTLTLSQFSQAYVDRRNSRLKHYAWISAKTDHKYFDFQALVCRLDADNAAELPEDCTLVLVVATNDQGKRITIGLPVYTYNQLLKSSNLPSIENFEDGNLLEIATQCILTSIIAPCLHSSIDIEEIEIGARDKLDEDFKTFFDQNLCISCSDSNNTRVFNFYYASDDKLNIDSQFHIEREVQLVNKPLVCAIQLAPITLSKEQLQQVAMHNLILLGEKPPSGQIAIKTGHLLLKYTTASDNNSINVSAIEQAEEEPLYAYIISTLNSLFQLLTTAPRAVNSVGAILDKAANLNKPCFLTTGTLRVSGTINEQRNSFLFVVQDLSH